MDKYGEACGSGFDPPTPQPILWSQANQNIEVDDPTIFRLSKLYFTFLRAGIGNGADNCDPTGHKDTALGTETITIINI